MEKEFSAAPILDMEAIQKAANEAATKTAIETIDQESEYTSRIIEGKE